MRRDTGPQPLAPDPELKAALVSVERQPPLDAVEWGALRSSIRARAELPLARRRGLPARGARGGRARVWRPLVPLAAAASVAMAVWLGAGSEAPSTAPAAQLSVEEVFHADLSEQEFRLLVTGRADPEELLLIALDER